MRMVLGTADMDDSGAFDNVPKFIAMLVGLEAEEFSSIDGDYLHGCLFVQCEALKVSPRAIFFFIVCETFHTRSIYQPIV